MELKKNYKSLNETFQNKLIFRLGADSGFFSEYNNMIFAILYCLKNKIQFCLSSNSSTLGKIGWENYFETFCTTNKSIFHRRNNFRGHYTPSLLQKIEIKIYNFLFPKNKLTQDYWNIFHNRNFENEYFNINELKINGKTFDIVNKIIDITWKFNYKTQNEIYNRIYKLNLPDKFIGIHIRRGDKIKESNNQDLDKYFYKIESKDIKQNIFISTDDFYAIEYLRKKYHLHNFYYLTPETARGYDQSNFNKLNELDKYNEFISFLTSIEILKKSQYCIGTMSSNVGIYLTMYRGNRWFKGVDFENPIIW